MMVEEMTQSAIADALGVGRVTVVRMLAEAKALGEVRTRSRAATRSSAVSKRLMQTLRVVRGDRRAALSSDLADLLIALRATIAVSALLRNDMKIGLGWGRTLNSSLEYLSERSLKGLNVVSLAGGVTHSWPTIPPNFPPACAGVQRGLLPHSFSLPRR